MLSAFSISMISLGFPDILGGWATQTFVLWAIQNYLKTIGFSCSDVNLFYSFTSVSISPFDASKIVI